MVGCLFVLCTEQTRWCGWLAEGGIQVLFLKFPISKVLLFISVQEKTRVLAGTRQLQTALAKGKFGFQTISTT